MSRVKPVTIEEAQGQVKETYEELQKKMGKVINIFQNMGNSPAVLQGFLSLSQAAEQTSIPANIREKIALLVGQTNHCNYCLSAHSMMAKNAGLNEQDILKARQGESSDPKTQAVLKFVKAVVETRGHVSNQEVASLKAAGVSDTELVEIILIVNVNLFTNYFNLITDPKIDFPQVVDLK